MEKMSDLVLMIMERDGLSQVKFANICGLDTVVISRVCNDKYVAMRTIAKIAESFPEFKQFIKYKKCRICGNDFLPGRRTVTRSKECQLKNNKEIKQRNNNKKRKSTVTSTNAERYNWSIKGLKQPETNIVQFMSGKPYAERQREYLLGIQKTQRMEIR